MCYFYNVIELRGDQGANTESFYAILIDANFKTWNLLQKFSKIMRDWRKLNLNRKYFETFQLTWDILKSKIRGSAVVYGGEPRFTTWNTNNCRPGVSIGGIEVELFFEVHL